MNYTHIIKYFKELTVQELYAIIRLRNEVFVVEQKCIFQDADNKDPFCHHLMLYNDNELIGYARLGPPGLSYDEMSISRVVTSPSVRGRGAGKKLMQLAINYCQKIFGKTPIKIGAQVYVEKFYRELGFSPDGTIYDDDGIDHIHMIWNP